MTIFERVIKAKFIYFIEKRLVKSKNKQND